ncbi:hypothetical protein [Adhaeribacter aerolatus]|uniref:hypothetical protein n=1 Tax=Adhaeribacter aerolatus TaxID=670289 RepID=UPI0011BF69F7|nr:hypothetical protein [Adhaeribacter aerolatus]
MLLFFSCSPVNTPAELPKIKLEELPKWTWPVIGDTTFKEQYEFNFRINPFYLQADFDKDGISDIAILIKEKKSGKTGLAILRNGHTQPSLFGAGQVGSYGGDDWAWLRTWKTETILPAGSGVQTAGDVLILFLQEKEQRVPWLFWDGRSWQWKAD